MSTQSEAILENMLIKQLVGLGYAAVKIHDKEALKRLIAAAICFKIVNKSIKNKPIS